MIRSSSWPTRTLTARSTAERRASRPVGSSLGAGAVEVTRASTLQVSAAFGAKEDELSRYFVNGIIDYGEPLRDLRSTLRRLVDQATSQRDPPPPSPCTTESV